MKGVMTKNSDTAIAYGCERHDTRAKNSIHKKISFYRWPFAILIFAIINGYAFRGVFFQPGIVGFGWDWAVYANAQEYLKRAWEPFYIWWDYGLGMYSSASLTSQLLYRLITMPFYPLAGICLNKVIIFIYPLIAACSMYYLSRKCFKANYYIAVISSILYMLSPMTYNKIVAGHQCWYFAIALFPLYIANLLCIDTKDKKDSLRRSLSTGLILSLILTGGAHMWLVCGVTFLIFFMEYKKCDK